MKKTNLDSLELYIVITLNLISKTIFFSNCNRSCFVKRHMCAFNHCLLSLFAYCCCMLKFRYKFGQCSCLNLLLVSAIAVLRAIIECPPALYHDVTNNSSPESCGLRSNLYIHSNYFLARCLLHPGQILKKSPCSCIQLHRNIDVIRM